MKKSTMKKLFKIAQDHIISLEDRSDFEQHWNDEEDFFETSIMSLELALIEAYKLGKKEASENK